MTTPDHGSLHVHWFLPTNGDGHQLTSSGLPRLNSPAQIERPPTLDYLRLVVSAAEQAGFDAIMLPFANGFEDPWLLTAALAQHVPRLRFLLTHRPGTELPSYVLQKCATLQQLAPERILLHIVSGSSPFEQKSLGDHLGHDARYARTAEFMRVFSELWQGRGGYHGKYYRSQSSPPPVGAMPPPLWFGGASPAAERVAAAQAQVYVMWGEPPEMIRQRISHLRQLARQHNRTLRFGLRVHVFTAATETEAWSHVQDLVADVPQGLINQAQRQIQAYESEGQRRQHQLLHAQRHGVHDLEVSPNLWAGVGLVRGGAGTGLVGSYDQVAQRIGEYHDMGVDHFILSGYPHLEEALHLGEHLLPRLQRQGFVPEKGDLHR